MSSNAVSMLRFARVTTEEPRRRRVKPATDRTDKTEKTASAATDIEVAAPGVPVRKRWPSLTRPAPAVLHG